MSTVWDGLAQWYTNVLYHRTDLHGECISPGYLGFHKVTHFRLSPPPATCAINIIKKSAYRYGIFIFKMYSLLTQILFQVGSCVGLHRKVRIESRSTLKTRAVHLDFPNLKMYLKNTLSVFSSYIWVPKIHPRFFRILKNGSWKSPEIFCINQEYWKPASAGLFPWHNKSPCQTHQMFKTHALPSQERTKQNNKMSTTSLTLF